VPVKVMAEVGAPGAIGVVALVAVTVAATPLDSPKPRAFGNVNAAAFPPLATDGLVTVTVHRTKGVVADVVEYAIVAVIDVALVTVEAITVGVKVTPVQAVIETTAED
jgi:hypothetical protein